MKVGLVEDERKLAESLREGLSDEGFQISAYYTGTSFLEALTKEKKFDALILDLALPDMSGKEISERVRQEKYTMPILILTAHDTVHDKVQAFESGADDFLAKPFAFEELVARLRALIRRSQTTALPYTAGEFVLDIYERTVRRGNIVLELTPTEFDLLRLFFEHRGKPLSREQISKSLWDSRNASLSNIVDVHISNLRKKLEETYATKLISTVRGMGYTLAQ